MKQLTGLVLCLLIGLPIFILIGIGQSIMEWADCLRKLGTDIQFSNKERR
jgi:hypothetical protein